MVQAFRRRGSIFESARLKLRGLDPEAQYTITNLDSPDKKRVYRLSVESVPGRRTLLINVQS